MVYACHDIVQRVYLGVLYFQNVTQFHGTCTNVISFAPIRQVQPFLPQFNENNKCTIGLGADLMY